jgi:MinD superfamily P-loop ATPase
MKLCENCYGVHDTLATVTVTDGIFRDSQEWCHDCYVCITRYDIKTLYERFRDRPKTVDLP